MSIMLLKKATIYGLKREEKVILQKVQSLGLLHLIPLPEGKEKIEIAGGVAQDSKEALRFLLQTPNRRKQVHDSGEFQAEHIKAQALRLKELLKEMEEEREVLKKRIGDLRPWGDFRLPPKDALGDLHLWFYMIPHNRIDEMNEKDLVWHIAGRDHRFVYAVIISENEPLINFKRTHTGVRPLSDYIRRLETIESKIEDLKIQRFNLTKWIDLYANTLHRLEDQEALKAASLLTYTAEELFVIQGWFPARDEESLRLFCQKNGAALVVEEPLPEETPPTLLENRGFLSYGEKLLTFYMTPGYNQYDPSGLFFLSFVLFFAIILGDAGYGAILGVGAAAGWRKLGKTENGREFRILLAALSLTTVVWGGLVGSYFGRTPDPGSVLSLFYILHLDDYDTMMKVSVTLGALHLILANTLVAFNLYRRGYYAAIGAQAGWIAMISAGLSTYIWPAFSDSAQWIGAGGILLVLFLSGAEEHGVKRALFGLVGLARITSAFGDILSYLRLFALGLATSSMAIAVNQLAEQVTGEYPGVGVLLGLLLLLIGHSLNLALGIVSGVVHGLRLNVIEYLNWGMPDEGRPYRPFYKKEQKEWETI